MVSLQGAYWSEPFTYYRLDPYYNTTSVDHALRLCGPSVVMIEERLQNNMIKPIIVVLLHYLPNVTMSHTYTMACSRTQIIYMTIY